MRLLINLKRSFSYARQLLKLMR